MINIMLETLENIINFVGIGNIISIIIFLLGTFIAFYFYYKTFYRLVYSTETICKSGDGYDDWGKESTIYDSRIIYYNNGRKTLTKHQIEKLTITSSTQIMNIRVLKNIEKMKANINHNRINITFDYLDSNDFFVLEISHKKGLDIEGRISETGEILHTETKGWLAINIIYMIFFLGMTIYNLDIMTNQKVTNYTMFALNFIILIGIYRIIRYIHKLFFIPDKLTYKYLEPKNKWNKQFMYEF